MLNPTRIPLSQIELKKGEVHTIDLASVTSYIDIVSVLITDDNLDASQIINRIINERPVISITLYKDGEVIRETEIYLPALIEGTVDYKNVLLYLMGNNGRETQRGVLYPLEHRNTRLLNNRANIEMAADKIELTTDADFSFVSINIIDKSERTID